MIDKRVLKFSKNKKIHAALDIGNSKIACMIAQAQNNDVQVKVLGFGQHVSMGFTQGKVTNLLKLSKISLPISQINFTFRVL